MKVFIVYESVIDWDWNVQKVLDSRPKAEKWIKDNQIHHMIGPSNIKLRIEEVEVE